FPVGRALARLPNGDIVVAGDFTSAGGVPVTGIARWDGSAWSAMPGLQGPVVLAVLPNGELIASDGWLWRWDGTTWVSFAALGSLNYPTVMSLAFAPNGDLIAGGRFTSISGTAATNLARWDGAAWHALGTSANPESPSSVCVTPGGEVFLGGSFTAI